MEWLLLTTKILRTVPAHSEDWVSSDMDSYTILLLLVSKERDLHFQSPRWPMGDQQRAATSLSSWELGANFM